MSSSDRKYSQQSNSFAGGSQNLKEVLVMIDRLSQVKNVHSYQPKDMVKMFMKMNDSDYQEDDDTLEGDFAADKAYEVFEAFCDKISSVSVDIKQAVAQQSKLEQQLQQLQSQQSKSQAQPRPSTGNKKEANFDSMITTMHRIVKLQAWFRKILTLKRLQKELTSSKAAYNQKRSQEKPEEQALKEFSQQLMQKNLTPEAFFRVCDPDYKQIIQAGVFKDQISKFGLKLSRGQMSRLVMILDEDMEGTITREEYYNALEAYNVSGEKHKSIDGSLYHPFEHRALFKLIAELRNKDISFLEMFNACDINDDTRVNIQEIQKFVEGLSPDFRQKEIHALMNYLDIDKNGLVDKDEFLRQLGKGEQTFKQSQILNKQIQERNQSSFSNSRSGNPAQRQDNFFDEVDNGAGTQSFFGMFSSKKQELPKVQDKPPVKQAGQAQPQQNLDPDTTRRKQIIEKMEKEGQNFTSFFASLKQMASNGSIQLGSLLKALELSYPTISLQDRNFLIKSSMIDARKVDFMQLESLFSKFSKNLRPSVAQTFSVIAANISKRMGSLPPGEAIRQFFKAQGIREGDELSDRDFSQMFSANFGPISASDLEQAFNSINIDLDGFIKVSDLVQVLISYCNQGETLSLNVKEIGLLVPGFETMSPRTRCEELIQLVINELKKKNMKPINVYRMADSKNAGSVQITLLEATFKKLLPNFKAEIIAETMTAFKQNGKRDIVSKQDFETVFDEDQNQYIPNSQSISKQMQSTTPTKAGNNLNEDQTMVWIRKLDNAMLREKVSPGVAFRAADVNHNGVVTIEELKESIKRLIPSDTLNLSDLKNIMKAFDQNNNEIIEESEFISLIEKARNTNMTVIESPYKSRDLGSSNYYDQDRKGALPLKNQNPVQQQVDQSQIDLVVDNIEKKLNLKKFFGELNINEDGNILVIHASQRFKAAKANDQTSLKPSEYLPIVKSLDPHQTGFILVRDILKFLERYASSFSTDCTLELKYIANFIEFQMRKRNTMQFLLESTKLLQGKRILEVEMMTEFQRVFNISIQIGRIIFNFIMKIKGKNDVFLEDFVKLIDQYRVVQVQQYDNQDLVKTQSQKVDSSKTLMKFVIALLSLNPRRRELIDNQLDEISSQSDSIAYKDFFDIFVTEYQLIDIPESKALFESLAQLGKKPRAIETSIFQQQIIQVQTQFKNAQIAALAESINAQGEAAFKGLTKIKMNELGYISKNGLKEHLQNMNVINRTNTNPQDTVYVKKLKAELNYEFVVSPQLQADEFVNNWLRNENETCKFWTVAEFMAQLAKQKEYMTPILMKYLGKLFDQAAPNKQTITAMQTLCPQSCLVQDEQSLANMYQKLEEAIMQRIPGYDQGQIRENSLKSLQMIYKQLGNKPFGMRSEEHVFIKYVNVNRAMVPKPGQVPDQMSKSLNDREVPVATQMSLEQIVKKIESQIGMEIEKACEFQYDLDQTPVQSFLRQMAQKTQASDKELLFQFGKKIDRIETGLIQTKDLVLALKSLSGKFDQQKVHAQLVQTIEGPLENFLSSQQIQPSDQYDKADFLDSVQSFTNLSKFHILCIFYELSKDQNVVLGKGLIQLLKDSRTNLGGKEEKKHVRFNEAKSSSDQINTTVAARNEATVKQLCQQFVSNYNKLIAEQVVRSALTELQKVMASAQNYQDAASLLDKIGRNEQSIDLIKNRLDSEKEFSKLNEDQKLIILFLYINLVQQDPMLIDIQKCAKTIRQVALNDQSQINQHVNILKNNLKVVRKYLGMPDEEQKSASNSLLNKSQGKSPDRKNRESEHSQKEIKKHAKEMGNLLPELNKILSDEQNKKDLIKMFVSAKDQNLSYRSFKMFLHKFINTKQYDPQLEVMEGAIDFDEVGKINFFDFIKFCERFQLPFQSDAAKKLEKKINKQEAGGQKLTCELLEYTITEKDYYFKGMKTILNSEKAALVVAEQIYSSLAPDQEFYDTEFGPKNDDDEDGNRLSLYCDGNPPKGYIEPEQISWLRPEEFAPEHDSQFIDDGAAANDVKQGKIGDCWFIGALSVLATRDELLRGGVGNIEVTENFEATNEIASLFSMGVYPPLFHYYRKKGIYVFRFFKDFNWRYVILDDRIPCFTNSKVPVFGTCKEKHEMWVPLLEKAYAKIHGCYESLISGFIDDALNDLTGLVAEKLFLHNEQKKFPHKSIKDKFEFWDYLMRMKRQKSMMGCSVVGDVERQIIQDGVMTGIMTGHAYGIIDVFEIKDSSNMVHKLLRVRNPWGEMEWKGKWSDKSEQMDIYRPELEAYIRSLKEDEQFNLDEEDGTFLINYRNWRDIFNNAYVCLDFPDDWSAIRFRGEWNSTTSGALPSPMTEENMVRWGKNPQYYFQCEEQTEIFISLAQPDGRAKQENGKYYKFPYSELIHQVIFSVFKLQNNQVSLDKFDKNAVKGSSVLKEHKEVSLRLNLEPGSYLIVPCTRNVGEYGKYVLSLYFNKDLRDVEVYRVGKPEDEYSLIEEETEKYDNVEYWKIDLTEKRIKFMIQQEDESLDMSSSQLMNNSKSNAGPKKLSQVMHRSTRKANAGNGKSINAAGGGGNTDFNADDAFENYQGDDDFIE